VAITAVSLHLRSQAAAHAVSAPLLLVANQVDRTMSIIDPSTSHQIGTVPTGDAVGHGHEVAASPDGRTAYVPIYGDSGVAKPGTDGHNMLVIDLPSQKVIGNVDFGHGVRPHCPVYDPVSKLLYVTTELDKTISIIDPKTLKIVGTIPTDEQYSHMLAIAHNGRFGYTANVKPGTVSVLDMKARKTITVIPISASTQRISISPDDSMVFTADQDKPQLAVIDTATNKVKAWVPLPGHGYGTASTVDGHWLLVTVLETNQVAIVNLKTLKVEKTIDVPSQPQEVLVGPGGKAYVSCNHSSQVAVIDTSSWKVDKLIDAGKGADGLAWAQ
jgi:YVTN family beta-propeller protein